MSVTKNNDDGSVIHRVPQGVNAVLLAGNDAGAFLSSTTVGARTPETGIRTGLRKVREIENIWIPMSDGTKIAARMWLPEDAEDNPVPVLMEYIPYRKRDGAALSGSSRLRDETIHPYLASYGYACVRPDIRGSGDSEGLPLDEYAKQEQGDGVEIIAWLARQLWCTGKVGMFGISWGGYSALQVAARCPPELSRWHDMWMERLKNVDYYPAIWLSHQRRDAYWKHASLNEDYENYGAIQCPVYAVGGWFDAYRRTVARMLANLKCPRKGLVGPWGHEYPNYSDRGPGPAIDWFAESLRWWDLWLKDIDTGIMDEPMYRVWMQEAPIMRGVHQIPGRWVAEESWPSSRIKPRKLYLTKDGLESNPGAETARLLKPLQTVGTTAPGRCVRRIKDAATDQRIDHARSLTFDSEPIEEDFEILGAPVVTLDLAVGKPVALLSVRLNEVEPDGLSKRVSYNVLNLTHRDSHEFPEPLKPGKRYRIRLPLEDCAHVFKSGRRIRVVVSTSHWPSYWPSPEPVTLTLYAGRSELELPVRPLRAEDRELNPFGPAFSPEPTSGRTVLEEAPEPTRVSEWDAATGKLTIRDAQSSGRARIDATGTVSWSTESEVKEILDHDPTSAKIEAQYITAFKRDEWNVRVESSVRVSVSKDDFLLVGRSRPSNTTRRSSSRPGIVRSRACLSNQCGGCL